MIDEHKFVQIGAGNIGRSFLGQLFGRAGFEVVFIDIDPVLIEALNRERRYRIEIKDVDPETIWIEGVRAVDGRDIDAAAAEIATCRLCATAVGAGAVRHVLPMIAEGLKRRWEAGDGPLDIIIAENLRNAAQIFRQGLAQLLPENFPIDEMVGLVETSIGKMVPIMPEEVRKKDPLVVWAEAYNTLICDAKGFKNPIPDVAGLEPKENMRAYVDRKLFVHNLGHAACAYFSFLVAPNRKYVWEAMEDDHVREATRRAMWESGRALIAAYPDEFNERNMGDHIEDLLRRFANRALGDTIYRVGRDLPRKLGREDRLVGAMLFDLQHGETNPQTTAHATAAGFRFRAADEHGQLYRADQEFADRLWPQGIDWVLQNVCGLRPDAEPDRQVAELIKRADANWRKVRGRERELLSRIAAGEV